MKNLRKPLVYVALALVPILFSKCTLTEDLNKLGNSLDSVKVMIGSPEFKTQAHFEFVDAKTRDYISGQAINVSVTGTNKLYIYDNIGNQSASYSTKMGILDLVIDPHMVDSSTIGQNPLRFNVTVSGNQYGSVTQQVVITDAKRQIIVIPLVKLDANSTPEGVHFNSNSNLAAIGSSKQTTVVSTHTINAGKQTLELPVGVVLKDANGNKLQGTVKSDVIYYDPISEASQDVIRGSLNGEVVLKDGTITQTKLVSAGMFTAAMTVDGTTVKSFEGTSGQGLKLKSVVPSTLINPNTGVEVKENDTIPMWSKEEGSGQWKFEKLAVVQKDKVTGELYLQDVVNHLSYWNWDWFALPYKAGGNSNFVPGPDCWTGSSKFVWTGPAINANNPIQVTATTTLNSSQIPYHVMNVAVTPWDRETQLYGTPSNISGSVTFKETNPTANRILTFNPAKIDFTNLCNGTAYTISITEKILKVTDHIVVNFDLTAKSTDVASKILIRPNATIYYRPVTVPQKGSWSTLTLKNGIAKCSLDVGQLYSIQGNFGSNGGEGTLLVQSVGTDKLQVTVTPTITYGNEQQAEKTVTSDPIIKPANNIIDVPLTILLSPSVFNKLK